MSVRDLLALIKAHNSASKSDDKASSSSGDFRGGVSFTGSKLRGSPSKTYKYPITLDHDALRAISRRNYFESTHARACIGRLSQSSVGTGLKLSCTPTWELLGGLGWSDEKKAEFTREVELRFFLWATSHECDALGRRTFGELQSYEFDNRLKDGETFAILRYSGATSRISPLSIQFVNPDQVADPLGASWQSAATARGNTIVDGIEFDSTGAEVAMYVCDNVSRKTERIQFNGATRRFVLHPAIISEIGQVRGVSPIAMLAHEISKLTDYTVAEIEAAINNAVIAAVVVPSANAPASRALSGIAAAGTLGGAKGDTSGPTKIEHAGFYVQNLKAGEDLKSFDTARPNVNFNAFVQAIVSYISAALGIPVEVLAMTFNQNYSASRASLILYWATVENWRAVNISQFVQPTYEAWFAEEVRLKRIAAPGFGDTPIITKAWLTTDWIGSSMPSIDPKKEAEADDLRIAQGATTHERNALKYNGSDFRDNCEKLAKEKEIMPKAPVAQMTTGNPANEEREDAEE